MKTKKIWPIILIVIIIATAAGVILFNSTDTARFRKQLNLGQRYLSEMNYEEAVVAFNQAIEIDPRSVDAYLGLADAYIGLGDEEAALAALKKGYEATGDERLKERIDEMEASREATAEKETAGQEEKEEAEIRGEVVTGTVQWTEDYFETETQDGDGWTWFCLVFEEPKSFTAEGETYTVSVLNISNGGDSDIVNVLEEMIGETITVDIEIGINANTNPMTRAGNVLWGHVWSILEDGMEETLGETAQEQAGKYTLTGIVKQSENYFERDPQLYDEWCTYCLVLDEPRTFEVDGEEYTVSILALDGAEYTEEYGDNPFPEFWGMKVKVENASVYKSRYNFDVSPLACYIDEIYANE